MSTKCIIKRGIPDYIPAETRRLAMRGGAFYAKFSFSDAERKVMKVAKPMPISQWAEKYRILEQSSIRGHWRNDITPYLKGIMDAAGMPGTETVILCKSPQTGGSEAGHNIVGYCIDRMPGPIMYVFPDEITARENALERIIPLIKTSPRLSRFLTGVDDDVSSLRIKLLHLTISLAWSGSVSRLGNKPVRILILDELDKYANPKNEARSEDLAEKRTTTWRNKRKIFKISTPTTEGGPIWTAFTKEANARFRYYVKCPECGEYQVMELAHLGWHGKGTDWAPDAETILDKKLGYYACKECGTIWGDSERDLAVRAGGWREEKSGRDMYEYISTEKPVKVGFHVPAFLSYFVSLSEIARAACKAEKGSIEDVKNFYNQYLGEPWKEQFEERSEDSILALCDDRPRGVAPSPLPGQKARISCLLAGVDTQHDYFRYVIRAYGYGESEESWLIQCGTLASWADLDRVLLAAEYSDGAGNRYKVQGIMIDAMGDRTRDVYAWAASHRGLVFPWQGKRSLSQPYTTTALEYFPGATGQQIRIPGGLMLYKCDTTFFKSGLAQKLEIQPEDPGAFHLHANGKGELNQYAKEMTSEVWNDEAMAWVNPSKRDNHFWDCEVMCSALAYIKGVRNIAAEGGERNERKAEAFGQARRLPNYKRI